MNKIMYAFSLLFLGGLMSGMERVNRGEVKTIFLRTTDVISIPDGQILIIKKMGDAEPINITGPGNFSVVDAGFYEMRIVSPEENGLLKN
jgi:hypothetical protein